MQNRNYKCLAKQQFVNGNCKIVPLRDEDKYAIRQWRNEQINILRQATLLTTEQQENYFATVVANLFEEEQPKQLLFSFFENDILIGYGGLVHIDWESKNAEVSFLLETSRDKNQTTFAKDFASFLRLMVQVSQSELCFFKLHTTFYNLPERTTYKIVLEDEQFVQEAILKNHKMINGKLEDVFIYSKYL